MADQPDLPPQVNATPARLRCLIAELAGQDADGFVGDTRFAGTLGHDEAALSVGTDRVEIPAAAEIKIGTRDGAPVIEVASADPKPNGMAIWIRCSAVGHANEILKKLAELPDETMRYRLKLPGNDHGDAVQDFISNWIHHPALKRIVEMEGGTWPHGSLQDQVEALHDFSDRWDFRGGAERLDIASSPSQQDSSQLLASAAELGLTTAEPPSESHYDHALVLGGTALANIYRLRRLYELREAGLDVGHIAVLTALRQVGAPELELVQARPDIAPLVEQVDTEFDVMYVATAAFSDSTAHVEHKPNPNPHLASAVAEVGDATVLAAPSGDPDRRANTRDNYDVYASKIGPTDSVLVVTSSIYLPYQFFIALQALGWEQPRTIEAVGFPSEWMEGVLTGPTNVLQELRSALFGARNTLRAIAAAE